MRADELMTRQVVALTPETSLKAAAEVLVAHQVASAPVLRGAGKLCGIVSEIDLLAHAVPPDPRAHLAPTRPETSAPPRTVGDVMTREVAVLPPQADGAAVLDLMRRRRILCVPVVADDGHLLGVISRRDLLRNLARPDELIAADVQRDIAGLLPSAEAESLWVRVDGGLAEIFLPATTRQQDAVVAAALGVPGVLRATLVAAQP